MEFSIRGLRSFYLAHLEYAKQCDLKGRRQLDSDCLRPVTRTSAAPCHHSRSRRRRIYSRRRRRPPAMITASLCGMWRISSPWPSKKSAASGSIPAIPPVRSGVCVFVQNWQLAAVRRWWRQPMSNSQSARFRAHSLCQQAKLDDYEGRVYQFNADGSSFWPIIPNGGTFSGPPTVNGSKG
jgi:hypothetical protein